jgi:DNA-binding MarR family transcriptional regulator
MATILIRCTGGTDIPADALAGWLEPQISRIDNQVRVTALRLAALEHVDEFSAQPAGWLVELDVANGQVGHAEVFLAEILSDMRLLGLRPAVFVQYGLATVPSPDVDAGFACNGRPLRRRVTRRDLPVSQGGGPAPADASRTNGRAVVRLLDAIDRAHLTTIDVLLLLHVAEAEGTVADLAERLDRRPVDVRRATDRLVARGLLRRASDHAVPWGLVLTATVSGLDLLRSAGLDSTLAGSQRRKPASSGAPRAATSASTQPDAADDERSGAGQERASTHRRSIGAVGACRRS